MPEHNTPHIERETPAEHAESRRRGYEVRDVRVRVIAALVFAVAALIVGSLWGLSLLLGSYEAEAKREDAPPSPLAEREAPPGPRLQSTPNRDFAEFRAQQERRLKSYGWVDREKKIAHIPVDRAMDLVIERGLPKPQPAEEPMDEEGAP
jgi:hypothetical protein